MKVIPLLMGIVTTATIVQPSVAMNPANSSSSPASKQPSSNLYAQIILNIGNSRSWREREREREHEREREREHEHERERERHERHEGHERWERHQRREPERERYEHGYY